MPLPPMRFNQRSDVAMRSLSRSLFRPKNGVDQSPLHENKPLVEKIESTLLIRPEGVAPVNA